MLLLVASLVDEVKGDVTVDFTAVVSDEDVVFILVDSCLVAVVVDSCTLVVLANVVVEVGCVKVIDEDDNGAVLGEKVLNEY